MSKLKSDTETSQTSSVCTSHKHEHKHRSTRTKQEVVQVVYQKAQAGKVGPRGLKGDTGDAGADGAQGLKGDTGDAGADGLSVIGPTGDKGDTGAPGTTDGTVQIVGASGPVFFLGGTIANLEIGSSGPWSAPGWTIDIIDTSANSTSWGSTNNLAKLTINPVDLLGVTGTASLINFSCTGITDSPTAVIGVAIVNDPSTLNTFVTTSIVNPPLSNTNTVYFLLKGSGGSGFSFSAFVVF